VEVQCAKTTTLVLWASVLALTVVVSGSYWIALGLAVFAGPMQAAVAFSSPVAFVSNRGRDNSSDRAILLGDSPCEGSARSLTIFGLFADLNQPHMVYSGRGS